MRPARPSALAAAAALCLAMLGSAALAQSAPDTQTPDPQNEVREETKPETEATPAEADADKRVCRYVKLDASSRRKTRVCRTVEEWRDLNNIR